MSWISSGSEFQHELHPEGTSRSYLLKNLSKPKGYGVCIYNKEEEKGEEKKNLINTLEFVFLGITGKLTDWLQNKQCTSLRFDNWTAEFSDFVFDEPIIQELSPFTVRTTPFQSSHGRSS